MVVDATVPSLVLLVVLLTAVLAYRPAGTLVTRLRRTRRTGAVRTRTVAPSGWCPRVVLLDDDRWPTASAA